MEANITHESSSFFSELKHKLRIARRIFIKEIYKLLGGINSKFQPFIYYHIKPGYHHAKVVEAFDDTGNKDEWQRDVYMLAVTIMQDYNFKKVVDVGCGGAYKLINFLGNYETIGIEISPTYEWLTSRYPHRDWRKFEDVDPYKLEADLIICADVIEHVVNPDAFMNFLSALNAKIFIINTPERDSIAGKNDYGPPENLSHFREWNAREFINYGSQWFQIMEQHIYRARDVTQVIVCKKEQDGSST